jgi:tripartite-type tricarboxylate transporter receptor subunit TctC
MGYFSLPARSVERSHIHHSVAAGSNGEVSRRSTRRTSTLNRGGMKRAIVSALLVVALSGVSPLCLTTAQAFPDRPIRLIVSSPPGGPPDIIARLVSDQMAAALGQPVVVENRTGGAGGTIGARSVIGAEPDGYTLLMGSTSSLIIAPLIYKNAGYTAETFTPVAGLAESAEILAVHPSVKARSVAELVALARTEPGALRYASAGVGTLPHIEGELLKARTGIDIRHIPYRGGGPALTGLLGGEVQIFFSALTQMLPYVRDGRLRGLAVTSATRSALAPALPTMADSGFDGFVTASINFIVAPPATLPAIRRRVSDAVARALASAAVKQAFARIGATARPATPDALAAYMAEQQRRWSEIVAATHISLD